MNIKEIEKEDYDVISNSLDQALDDGLEIEIIYWALIAMKKDPSLTPGQAMMIGLTEWMAS